MNRFIDRHGVMFIDENGKRIRGYGNPGDYYRLSITWIDESGQKYSAHVNLIQLILWKKTGRLPDKGEVAMHSCVDRRWCVNEEHLSYGTMLEYSNDRWKTCPRCGYIIKY